MIYGVGQLKNRRGRGERRGGGRGLVLVGGCRAACSNINGRHFALLGGRGDSFIVWVVSL